MSAKWSISEKMYVKGCLALLFLVLADGLRPLRAQEHDTPVAVHDTVTLVVHDTVYLDFLVRMASDTTFSVVPAEADGREEEGIMVSQPRKNRYDRRVHRYRRRWQALIPTHVKLQYAGNMGLLSLGTGWDYGKRNQWETDIYLGFLPKYDSHENKLTFTVKQNYIPWSLQVRQSRFSVEPLTCGMYLNSVLADEFWVKEPSRYPSGYYGFSSKIRIHVFLGQRLTYDINPKYRFLGRAVTFYYELSTCDLYLVSAFTNKYLKPKDYLSLSFGVKFQLL